MELFGGRGGCAGAGERFAVVPEEAMPVLLAPGGAGAPAKPDNAVGAVGHLLKGNLSDLARVGVAPEARPAAGSGGLLHDPDVLPLETPHGGGRGRGTV